MSDSLARLQAELRETPLAERMADSCCRIGNMCSQGRPPAMSIPVRSVDDDFYITTTVRDAIDEIERLRAQVETLTVKLDDARYQVAAGDRLRDAVECLDFDANESTDKAVIAVFNALSEYDALKDKEAK